MADRTSPTETDYLMKRKSPAESRSDSVSGQPIETFQEGDGTGGVKMKKQLGLVDGVGIIVGIIIGSGIFISPTGVVKYAGSAGASLIVWVIAGMFSTIGAFCYAELGTTIPKSGGDYSYIKESLGNLPAFLFLWVSLIIIIPTSVAVVALTFANYVMYPLFLNCDVIPPSLIKLVGALVISLIIFLNCSNVKLVTKIQDIFTLAKLFVLVVIILAGVYHLASGHTENYKDPFKTTNMDPGALATSVYQGLFSFSGWNCLNFVVEEMKDPYRTLPRAIWISLPLITFIYALTNVAYLAVLTPIEIVSSAAVAVSFGDRMLGSLDWIIPFFVACSTFGSLTGRVFSTSRLFFVGAREGHLPDAMALIHVNALTPVPALLTLGTITLLMLIPSNIQTLINYIAFTESLFIFLCVTGLLWMRFKYPDIPRPIKIFIGFPILFFIVCLFLLILPAIEDPQTIGIACIIILSGVPVYYVFIAREKSAFSKKISKGFTSLVQKLVNALPDTSQV